MEIEVLGESEKIGYNFKGLFEKNSKKDFFKSSVRLARELRKSGHEEESHYFLMICDMYYEVIERLKS